MTGGAEERRSAAHVLRRGHALATRLGARPEREAIEAVARSSRVALTAVVPGRADRGPPPVRPSTRGGEPG